MISAHRGAASRRMRSGRSVPIQTRRTLVAAHQGSPDALLMMAGRDSRAQVVTCEITSRGALPRNFSASSDCSGSSRKNPIKVAMNSCTSSSWAICLNSCRLAAFHRSLARSRAKKNPAQDAWRGKVVDGKPSRKGKGDSEGSLRHSGADHIVQSCIAAIRRRHGSRAGLYRRRFVGADEVLGKCSRGQSNFVVPRSVPDHSALACQGRLLDVPVQPAVQRLSLREFQPDPPVHRP